MTTWRHTGTGEWCDVDIAMDPLLWPPSVPVACGCTTPTPDPASCAVCAGGPSGGNDGPHVPTRCTCGHPIEEATR